MNPTYPRPNPHPEIEKAKRQETLADGDWDDEPGFTCGDPDAVAVSENGPFKLPGSVYGTRKRRKNA